MARDPFQVGLSLDEIINTPSLQNGLDPIVEYKLRIYGSELIQKAGILLRLYP